MSTVLERSTRGPLLARTTVPIAIGAALDLAVAAALTLLGALIRWGAQDGIFLHPDSYQFLLTLKGLAQGPPLADALGPGGDAWSIPFYRLGYPLLAFPVYLLTRDPELAAKALSFVAATATIPTVYFLALLTLRSRAAAVGAGLAVALSFSSAAWSRFVMPEATAAFLLALAMLLAYLAGRSGRPTPFATCAALAAALLVLVRLELILAVPSLAVFLAIGARHSQRSLRPVLRTYLASVAALLVAFAAALWWMAGDVISGFSLNPASFLSDYLLKPTAEAHEGTLVFTGLHDFLNQEPLLVISGGLGLLLATRWRPEYRWALWLQVAPLFVVYLLRNDMRYFAILVPALAFAAGLIFREAWAFLARFSADRDRGAAPALALSGAFSVVLLGLALWQVDLTDDTWHASGSYEYAAARAVEGRL
ncbi:MAG: glycosyltransferase family 39 protein, partial [Chloroflexota bacterium]|nr:glycosyltransferase family 39 protein [Chloroflexota bacterium]